MIPLISMYLNSLKKSR